MSTVALIFWILTALGGLALLGIWLAGGGLHQQRTHQSRLRAPMLFGHVGLAGLGLLLWISYLALHAAGWAWGALALLLLAAVLGLVMLAAWLASGGQRSKAAVRLTAITAARRGEHRFLGALGADIPAEHRFPVPLVAGHGLLAAITVVLVLLVLLTTLG